MAKAVILAGGFGKRLRPLTEDRPKPLVDVAGRPIIEWQILWLRSHGVREFVILLGYKWERLVERLGSGQRLGVRIAYVVEDEPLGTGGAIKNAEHLLKGEDYFIVLNGDIITNLDVNRLVAKLANSKDALVAMALVPLRSPYGVVELDQEDHIVRFVEKPTLDYWINAGVYAMKPGVLDYLPEKGDIERTAFPRLAEERRILGERFTDAYWRSIDTIKDLEEAARQIEALRFEEKFAQEDKG
ncbi:sugar phosphate nucleotidyltransferase [Pyrodictium delaneyi]|uniref:Nucleotidyltransferase n=1 Tax=Pyrodictium delaneyi TaxID=1273541 RepID=A0A0P0N1U7_9CREN|nr:nucleotidyltransferase family protein [Pyrodictium delaneyi]ALL00276.1 sugar phosphate nucleotidyltransferase [Pyrodictium delaneyi]OWJ54349.1 nucleotidyltransferase [Pyrodictium delaneyi]